MNLFGVKKSPSDTQMRAILDSTDPQEVRKVLKWMSSICQRSKILEKFVYFQDSYQLGQNRVFFHLKFIVKTSVKRHMKMEKLPTITPCSWAWFIQKAVLPFAPVTYYETGWKE